VALTVLVRCRQAVADDLHVLKPFIALLAGVGQLSYGPDVQKPPEAATAVYPEFEAYVLLRGLIDRAAEIKRLEKQRAEKVKYLQTIQAKLENSSFVNRAPADVVQQQRDLVAELEKQLKAIEENLRELRQE